MATSPITVGTDLARLLAGLPTLWDRDEILCTGKLPVDDRSRAIIDRGILGIRDDLAQWDTSRQRPDWKKTYTAIAVTANALRKAAFQDAAGRQAVSKMEEGVWRPAIDASGLDKKLTEIDEAAVFYGQFYGYGQKKKTIRSTERDNLLFYRFYQLHQEIKGRPPGIAGPLYRFTIKGGEVLGIKLTITQDAFRMRIRRLLDERRRLLDEQRNNMGSLAAVL